MCSHDVILCILRLLACGRDGALFSLGGSGIWPEAMGHYIQLAKQGLLCCILHR